MVEQRPIIYCVIPSELGSELHETLREFYRADPTVQVIVDQRSTDRRRRRERRAAEKPVPTQRRRVRSQSGRRLEERRAQLVAASAPAPASLPPAHLDQITFVERLEPSTLQREDADTARLIAKIQSGRSELFSELYMRYFDRIYAYLRITLQDTHEAEDATQEVFIRVFEALPKYERRSVPFRAWLFRIVRNSAINRLRQRKRLTFESPEALNRRTEAQGPVTQSLDWLDDRDLVGLIEQLPIAQRQVIVLRYMLELRSGEIAEILDRSPDAVRQLHQRAMRFLRGHMDGRDDEQQSTESALGSGRVTREPMRRARRTQPVLHARRFMLR